MASRSLVMSRGKRFESSRRLSNFLGIRLNAYRNDAEADVGDNSIGLKQPIPRERIFSDS
jgi:hypothetical protein